MAFKIIKHRGTPREAKLPDGTRVFRTESVKVEWNTPDLQFGEVAETSTVKCAPYDDHFVFETPVHLKGTPAHMCTCGSPAIVVLRILGEHPELGGVLSRLHDDLSKNPRQAILTLAQHPELMELANAMPNAHTDNMLVCMFYMQYGKHTTTFVNQKDFGKQQNILVPELYYRDRAREG